MHSPYVLSSLQRASTETIRRHISLLPSRLAVRQCKHTRAHVKRTSVRVLAIKYIIRFERGARATHHQIFVVPVWAGYVFVSRCGVCIFIEMVRLHIYLLGAMTRHRGGFCVVCGVIRTSSKCICSFRGVFHLPRILFSRLCVNAFGVFGICFCQAGS